MSVTMKGYFPSYGSFTFHGPSTLTADDILKPVVLDTASANTVKLASDGEVALGIIEQIEDRSTQGEGILVTVRTKYGEEVSYSGTLAVGDLVVANGTGGFRKADEGSDTIPTGVILPRVFEITDDSNHFCVIANM